MKKGNRLRWIIGILVLSGGVISSTWWLSHRAGVPSVDTATNGSTKPADPESRRLEEDEIAETVFRYQFKQCFPDRKHDLYFLARNSREDPSDAFMKRFEAEPATVKRFSNSAAFSGHIGDKASGKPGILLGVNNIKWVDHSTVEVSGTCYVDGENLMGYVYNVVCEGNKWIVKGTELTLVT